MRDGKARSPETILHPRSPLLALISVSTTEDKLQQSQWLTGTMRENQPFPLTLCHRRIILRLLFHRISWRCFAESVAEPAELFRRWEMSPRGILELGRESPPWCHSPIFPCPPLRKAKRQSNHLPLRLQDSQLSAGLVWASAGDCSGTASTAGSGFDSEIQNVIGPHAKQISFLEQHFPGEQVIIHERAVQAAQILGVDSPCFVLQTAMLLTDIPGGNSDFAAFMPADDAILACEIDVFALIFTGLNDEFCHRSRSLGARVADSRPAC